MARRMDGKSDRLDAEQIARAVLGRDLDRDPQGQVRDRRGDPHPPCDPRQRGQGPHPGVQHALGRHDRRTVTAPRRARRAHQADVRQPLPTTARPRPMTSSCWPTTPIGCSRPASKTALRDLARRWKNARRGDQDAQPADRSAGPNSRPELVELHGVGVELAGQFLVTAGDNAERIHSEAAFAKLCGVAPQPASSGRTSRSSPTQPRRRPSREQRALHRDHRPDAPPPADPRLRRTAHRRRTQQTRDHPLPQALHRPRDLQQPPTRKPTTTRSRSLRSAA